jgi:hypothetical protein
MNPHKQMFSFTREESDLPPQVPNHLLRNSKQNKKNVRIRSLEDHQRQRQSHSNQITHDDSATSHRSNNPTFDLVHRPLWNYQNPAHREYIPNSKRDPYHDKRQRNQGNSNRIDDVQKKRENYNRWNSDSEIQHEQKENKLNSVHRSRSSGLKTNNQKDESINNLLKGQKPKQDVFLITNTDEQSNYNTISSLDKYENFTPYIRTDEILDPAKAFSPVPQSREASAHRQRVRISI